MREGEPAAIRVQREPTKTSTPKLPASWKKTIEEFKHAKAKPQEPVDPVKLEHDYTNALDYINDFYGNSLKCLDFAQQAESTAIGTFTRIMSVPDAPDVVKEIVLTIVGVGFNAVGGWNLIEQGMTKGIFATNVWNMERSIGEKIGTVGMAKIKALGPGERDELLGKFLTERAKEGVEAGKTAHEVGEKSEGGSSVGETVETANKAAEKSLLDWGTYSATALQEKQIAKSHLKQLYDGHATSWGDTLESLVKNTLGPIPDAQAAGKHVLETAHKVELELYKEHFSGERTPHVQVIQGDAGVYSRTAKGIPQAVSARIAELLGWPKDELRVVKWLGGTEEIQRVHESGKFQ